MLLKDTFRPLRSVVFSAEKPNATGTSACRMSFGSPGMEAALQNHMKWFCSGPLAGAPTCALLGRRLWLKLVPKLAGRACPTCSDFGSRPRRMQSKAW